MKRLFTAALAAAIGLCSTAAYAQPAPGTATPAAKTTITGTMDMAFHTRGGVNRDGDAPKKGVADEYKVNLTVNGTNRFAGTINRQPRITRLKVQTLQPPRLDYKIDVFVPVRGSETNVGSWVGPINLDEKTGAFDLNASGDRALRMAITAGSGYTDNFGGIFYGKAADKSKLSMDSIKRMVNGKVVEKKFEADPMRFGSADGQQFMTLAKGPNPTLYSPVAVSGELSYDRETANYYSKNLRFRYTVGGKPEEDLVTGGIKWVEDPQRMQNGKGYYQIALFIDEEQNKKKTDDQVFGGNTGDDEFFAPPASVPAFVGRIEFVDKFDGSAVKDANGNPQPTFSKATYNIEGINGATPQQMMYLAKFLLVTCGPMNDE